jgi:hypothetical protein
MVEGLHRTRTTLLSRTTTALRQVAEDRREGEGVEVVPWAGHHLPAGSILLEAVAPGPGVVVILPPAVADPLLNGTGIQTQLVS